MHPDVDWPNAFEGGRVHGHAEVRAYWARQFAQIEPRVTPKRFTATDGRRVAVEVHQVVHDLDGNLLSDSRVKHVYSIRDGLVERMDVEDKV
jgi:ketosteroid isomerase-like protein